jgi:malonate transporter and related proteins
MTKDEAGMTKKVIFRRPLKNHLTIILTPWSQPVELVFKAVFSTFAIIILGFLAEKFKILGQNSERVLNNFVYYFAMPTILFIAMANEDITTSMNLPFISAFGLSAFIVYVLGFGISIAFKPKEINFASMRALSMSSPNTAYMGIPVLMTLFGEKALVPITVATFLLVLTTMLSIIIMEINNNRHFTLLTLIKKLILSLIKNPLIMAPFLGMLFACTRLHLPSFIETFGHQFGATAGPCALFAIGQTLVGKKLFAEKLEIGEVGFSKLLLQPALMFVFILMFKVSPLWAACGLILSALPCAAITYIVAQQYKIYEHNAAALIFATIVLSIITLTLFIHIAYTLWPATFLP